MPAASARSSLNDVEVEPEIPRTPLMSRREPEPAPEPLIEPPVGETRRAEQPIAPAQIVLPKHLLRFAERHRPKPDKKQTTVRFEPWLSAAINNYLAKMQLDLNISMTRETLITEAVIQYLGIRPPQQ